MHGCLLTGGQMEGRWGGTGECFCLFVCLFVGVLSDGDSQLLQHSRPFLLVLLPCHPEVVLVLHDVGQHGAAQEHHVFTPGRVLDADLKLLHKQKKKERRYN